MCVLRDRAAHGDDHAPWKPVKTAWSKAEFLSGLPTRAHGLEVIPELKLLTHQEQFFQQHYPGLMFNAVSYDPRKEGVYQVVFELLDELIDALHLRAIHISHDEAFRWTMGQVAKWLRFGEAMVPADLFARDVDRIHWYLTQKGVETWMWADMLPDPAEFPMSRPSICMEWRQGMGKFFAIGFHGIS